MTSSLCSALLRTRESKWSQNQTWIHLFRFFDIPPTSRRVSERWNAKCDEENPSQKWNEIHWSIKMEENSCSFTSLYSTRIRCVFGFSLLFVTRTIHRFMNYDDAYIYVHHAIRLHFAKFKASIYCLSCSLCPLALVLALSLTATLMDGCEKKNQRAFTAAVTLWVRSTHNSWNGGHKSYSVRK